MLKRHPDCERRESHRPSVSETGLIYSQRAFKKSSQNGKLTLYLASRDLVVTAGKIDKLQGVLLIDPEILQNKKVYGQVTLTFRYGREDEEVMGLKFCNEAIMSLAQLYPPYYPADRQEPTTPFQEVLVKRFHPNAHPFTMAVTPLAPPSVQLVPAKEYNGAPIGTSYDVRVYAAERPDEKLTRKMQIIKMGIRVIQGANTPPPSRGILPTSVSTESAPGTPSAPRGKPQRAKSASAAEDVNEIKPDEADPPIPHAVVEKQFLLSDGRVRLEASLDRAIYGHGDAITVRVHVTNNSGKSVKRIEADIVQHVDVCMFSNGKFKNIVAQMSSREGCPVEPGFSLTRSYILRPEKGSTKNWIALEDDPGYAKSGANLASTVLCSGSSPEDRNVFAIYVSYYVKTGVIDRLAGAAGEDRGVADRRVDRRRGVPEAAVHADAQQHGPGALRHAVVAAARWLAHPRQDRDGRRPERGPAAVHRQGQHQRRGGRRRRGAAGAVDTEPAGPDDDAGDDRQADHGPRHRDDEPADNEQGGGPDRALLRGGRRKRQPRGGGRRRRRHLRRAAGGRVGERGPQPEGARAAAGHEDLQPRPGLQAGLRHSAGLVLLPASLLVLLADSSRSCAARLLDGSRCGTRDDSRAGCSTSTCRPRSARARLLRKIPRWLCKARPDETARRQRSV
ncbi:uncharacterized protein LOC100117419 isoform X2 [Nasonia vitripennis]|uniref:Arrestin C-terminal-like domain-containing protein n=1 Tax=Nasonia vitripennis TaxID=7425 RepID=A0A7M7IMK4_NASVI|nr:uncharacterized protein LOC100117419 isoform X2 [Nasonia vitripennis]